MSSIKFPSEKDDDFPLTPQGDKLTDEWLMKSEGAINTCGDRLLDIWRDYKHYLPIRTDKYLECGDKISELMTRFGQLPFAICIVVFYENLGGDESINVFNMSIANFFNSMPENVHETVERLRYINTKFLERKRSIMSQLIGDNLGTKP